MRTSSLKAWLTPVGATALAAFMMFSMSGCNGCGNSQAPIVNNANGPDPADANMAQAGSGTQVMGTSQSYTPQQQGENYNYPQTQQAAPVVQGYPQTANDGQQAYDQGYNNSQAAGAAEAEADQPPPPLPDYDQPPAPDDNDIWTPGYWGYGTGGYYWVPGVWVTAPYAGALWTPGYWGLYSGRYGWHHGYWGPHIGFYGGINYGFGYIGTGYYGGYWNGPHFYYNRDVTRVSTHITNVYERNVVVNNIRYTSVTNNRVSYNGGRGGIEAQPRPFEVAAMHEQHVGPLPAQQQFHQQAANNRANFFNDNHGRPAMAAAANPVTVQHIAAPAGAERGGFGGRPGEPAANMNHPGQPGANPAAERNAQIEQQRNVQMQQQHSQEMQRNVQMQQQHNQEMQRNVQQHNTSAPPQHTPQQFQNNALQQQRNQETEQRNALTQQHQQQQVEQQRQQQEQQQRNLQVQQQQQHTMENQQHNFQPQPQQKPMEQARPQPQQQPHPQPQPQHTEQPRPMEQHSAPAPQTHAAPAPHPSGGGEGGHPGGHPPR